MTSLKREEMVIEEFSAFNYWLFWEKPYVCIPCYVLHWVSPHYVPILVSGYSEQNSRPTWMNEIHLRVLLGWTGAQQLLWKNVTMMCFNRSIPKFFCIWDMPTKPQEVWEPWQMQKIKLFWATPGSHGLSMKCKQNVQGKTKWTIEYKKEI